jgi:two-component system, sensor histidine kinase and response regulator
VFQFTVPLEVVGLPSGPPSPAQRRNLEEWGVQVVEAADGEAAQRALDQREKAPSEAAPRPARSAGEALRILLAEDSVVNQRVTSGLLEALGHSVDTVGDGADAVAAAAKERYDLVLMDLQMPVMGGLDATSAIRRREAVEGGHLPIVALTARAMEEDRRLCLAAGMDGYLAKPLRHAEIEALVAGLTAGRRSSDRDSAAGPVRVVPVEASPERATAGVDRSSDVPFPEGGAVDWSAALDAVDGDAKLLGRVVDATLEEGPTLLEELRRRAAGGDAEGLRRAAHKLEGTLRCVRDLGLLALAEDLEARARRGDLAAATEEIEELAARLGPVLAAFEVWRSRGRTLS